MNPLPRLAVIVLLVAGWPLAGCQTSLELEPQMSWAIAIHGGAGTMDPNAPREQIAAYEDALTRALSHGRDMLTTGASALDVCETVVRMLEDNPMFNAGKGAVFNEKGEHELDASIMDGSTMQCGAVAGVRTVRHPISLARKVMTETRHVLLAGDGAEQFADVAGVERVENSWFDTDERRRALERVLQERQQHEQQAKERTGAIGPADGDARDRRDTYGTVGCVVLDRDGRLAAATSTGGMTGKKWGRIGDTPILGAGNYADGNAAISCTGTGEEFIRHGVARQVAARMEYGGQSLQGAARSVVHYVLQPGDGGLIAVDRFGNVTAAFNSTGMYRGLANSLGRFEVAIFASEAPK